MKALSIKNPMATLIALGIKPIENRNWKTHFRGRVYIHVCAQYMNTDFLEEYINTERFNDMHRKIRALGVTERTADYLKKQPTSAIIGEVDIVDCVINHSSIWADKTPFKEGVDDIKNFKPIYNWVLANPVLYDKPILNVKWKLSFWDWKGCELTCESCEKVFDMNDMQRDGDDNYFCKECADELFPIMKKEYEEMLTNGEIEPD